MVGAGPLLMLCAWASSFRVSLMPGWVFRTKIGSLGIRVADLYMIWHETKRPKKLSSSAREFLRSQEDSWYDN